MSAELKLVTFAVPVSGNKGSASMFLGLRQAFLDSQWNVAWSVFSYYPSVDKQLVADREWKDVSICRGHPKDLAFKLVPALCLYRLGLRRLPARIKGEVETLLSADAVLLIGGTTFSDFMLYKTPWNALAALPALVAGRPVLKLSQTLGPFKRTLNRILAKIVCRKLVAIHARGRRSAQFARDIGVKRISYQPDLSFSLKVPNLQELGERDGRIGNVFNEVTEFRQKAVAIAPNTIVLQKLGKQRDRYFEFLVNAVQGIEQLNCVPVLLPHSYRSETTSFHNNDRLLCAEVMKRLPRDTRCYFIDADLEAGELRAVIGECQLLVASRFHSMISALAMGVPPLTYGWGGHKYTEVLEEFGVPELYYPYTKIDPEQVGGQISSALARRPLLVDKILAARKGIVSQAGEIPEIITGTIR